MEIQHGNTMSLWSSFYVEGEANVVRKFFATVVLVVMFLTACSHEETKPLTNKSVHGDLPSIMKTQEVTVEMYTEKPSDASSRDEIILVVKNLGPASLRFGTAYTVEKREQGIWYEVPFKENVGFAEVGLVLEPNDTYQQKINRKAFDYTWTTGEYRVIKSFYANEQKITLAAHFQIDEHD
jgi:hypothetical protein